MDATQVGNVIRSARKRQRMSQRAYAQHLGINRARLARLEVDAGRQPFEHVAQVLARSVTRGDAEELLPPRPRVLPHPA